MEVIQYLRIFVWTLFVIIGFNTKTTTFQKWVLFPSSCVGDMKAFHFCSVQFSSALYQEFAVPSQSEPCCVWYILYVQHDFTAGSWSQGLVVYGDLPPLQQEIQPLQTQCCHRMAVILLCKYLRTSTMCVSDVITSICFILIDWLNFSCTVILGFCSLFRK
jgi:hypothetical protein